MKMKNLFFSMLACTAFYACSSDEAVMVQQEQETPKVFTGDVAYMNIILSDAASGGTRASSPDNEFEYGTEAEKKVSTAHFYFYDKNGVYVSEAEVWNGGKESDADLDENIEFRSNTTIILKGLTGKTYPQYLVTVLNKDSKFVPGQNLDDMLTKLADVDTTGIITESGFTMSTTSVANQTNLEGKYFVTELSESNFSEEPINLNDESLKPVEIYVERLAAKVTLNVASALGEGAITVDGKTLYPIKATVAGEDNELDNTIGSEVLYVNILGWKLNATAKHSYMMKHLNEKWGNLGFVWNSNDFHRSYWGESWVYGKNNFPVNASDVNASNLLNYYNLNSNISNVGESAYCPENTNTSEIVSSHLNNAVTSILLKAEICDKNGKPLNLVRYNGMLFNEGHFRNYIIASLDRANKLNVYYDNGSDDEAARYVQIDSSFVELASAGNGKVKVVLKSETGKTFTDSKGNALSEEDLKAFANDLAEESGNATGYKGGLMYYNIPIEHLNNNKNEEVDGKTIIPEGKYGVVRNHHYVVNVNKLENPGVGIFDPNEVIIPNEDPEKFYYVGAQINILSWKIVDQNVEL